ncbi:MAG: xylulokinase [candidate division Zixibacteria bacterium]|nr:xylulokinase [candidate division Zixibacteria bacterium]
MPNEYVIGIDVGTSGCKVLLIDNQGKIIARAVERYSFFSPHAAWAEQNPEDWWQALRKALPQVLNNIPPQSIRGIGLCGQMHGLVALDKNYSVIRPCIMWNDQRSGPQCEAVYECVGGEDILIELINNRMLPGYTAGKILWIRDEEPQNYERIRVILNPKDYIRFRLTGDFATEVSDASGTGLFDVRKRSWCSRLLELLEIPTDWVPRCYESPEITGKVTQAAAEETGLQAGIDVVGGGGDAVIQTTGTGVLEPGILGTTIGTAGNVTMALDQCHKNPNGKLQIFCNNVPGRWHAMGVTLSAGGSLRWLGDVLRVTERELLNDSNKNTYDILTREAEQARPGAENLIFLPYMMGERCPHADPKARGVFMGLTLLHKRSHVIRSVLEGVILSLWDVTQVMKEMGVSIRQVRTSGGGALSPLWRQIHADIFNQTVYTVSGSGEGGAYGAALVAGAGVGIWSSVGKALSVLKIETETHPIVENTKLYENLYRIYRNLYGRLKSTYNEISSLPD